MITLVSFGLCFLLLFLVMEAQNEVYLLVVFLTTWMTVDWVSLAITQRTHFYPPWAVGLVATGVTLGVWALKPVTVQNLLVLSLLSKL